MKELTKAEEQLMKHLWSLENAYLKDLVERYPTPKPAYTTISTVVNVLVKKEMIGFETFGKIRKYHPILTKQQYMKQSFKGLLKGLFNDSPRQFASFFTQNDRLSLEDLEEIRSMIDGEIEKQKKS